MNKEPVDWLYMLPEYKAMSGMLDRTGKMQKLSVDLMRQEKLTQSFFKRFYEEILEGYFDVEQYAIDAIKRNRNYASDINALEDRIRMLELRIVSITAGTSPP